MKLLSVLLLLATAPFASAASEKNCGCACCKGKAVCCCAPEEESGSPAAADDSAHHPLRGVIVAVHVDDSTLTVKHEAIPGVMPAMTMLFKVDAATLQTAKKGLTITAQMSRIGEDWWLHDVKPTKQNKG